MGNREGITMNDEAKALAVYVYGQFWQNALARDLKVNPSTVKRWASGHTKLPEYALKYLVKEAAERQFICIEFAARAFHDITKHPVELPIVAQNGWGVNIDCMVKMEVASLLEGVGIPAVVRTC